MTTVYSLHGLFCYAEDPPTPRQVKDSTIILETDSLTARLRGDQSEGIECVCRGGSGKTGYSLFASLNSLSTSSNATVLQSLFHPSATGVLCPWKYMMGQSSGWQLNPLYKCFGANVFQKTVLRAGRRQLMLAVTSSPLSPR